MSKTKKTINNLKYAIPLVAALAPQGVKAQYWFVRHMPTEKINMYISQDNTLQAAAYNNLSDLAKQNDTIQSRLNKDWVSTVAKWEYDNYPTHLPPPEYPVWECGHTTIQMIINANKKFALGIYGGGGFNDDRFLYHKYTEFNLDSILKNEGTFKNGGELGLPIYTAVLSDSITLSCGHAMNALLKNIKGSSMTKWESWNFIEPQLDQINVQPGQAYMPKDCSSFTVLYWYLHDRPDGKKELAGAAVAFFTIKDGVATFGGLNPNLKDLLITDWENDNPILEVYSTTNPNKLKGKATDANLKDFVYSADGGAEKSLTSDVETDMGLAPGNHTVVVTARDYFRLISDTTFTRTIPLPTNNAPTVTIITPKSGEKYDKDVRLKGSASDSEKDPMTLSYRLDGGAPITIGQDFDEPLSLANGLHKILVYVSDPTHTGKDATKDSTMFEFKKAVGIEPGPASEDKTKYGPNPVDNNLHLIYKSNLSGNAYMTLTTLEGETILRKSIGKRLEEDLDMTKIKPGIYILKVVDRTETQRIKIIKK